MKKLRVLSTALVLSLAISPVMAAADEGNGTAPVEQNVDVNANVTHNGEYSTDSSENSNASASQDDTAGTVQDEEDSDDNINEEAEDDDDKEDEDETAVSSFLKEQVRELKIEAAGTNGKVEIHYISKGGKELAKIETKHAELKGSLAISEIEKVFAGISFNEELNVKKVVAKLKQEYELGKLQKVEIKLETVDKHKAKWELKDDDLKKYNDETQDGDKNGNNGNTQDGSAFTESRYSLMDIIAQGDDNVLVYWLAHYNLEQIYLIAGEESYTLYDIVFNQPEKFSALLATYGFESVYLQIGSGDHTAVDVDDEAIQNAELTSFFVFASIRAEVKAGLTKIEVLANDEVVKTISIKEGQTKIEDTVAAGSVRKGSTVVLKAYQGDALVDTDIVTVK